MSRDKKAIRSKSPTVVVTIWCQPQGSDAMLLASTHHRSHAVPSHELRALASEISTEHCSNTPLDYSNFEHLDVPTVSTARILADATNN